MSNWEEYKKTFPEEGIFDWARSGDLNSLVTLLSTNSDFDLDQKNGKGYSALMLAVYNNQEVFAEALLRCSANANSVDDAGNSVLMGAAFKGNIQMIKTLVLYGADVDLKNQMGMSAYDWAKTFGRKEAQKTIEHLGFEKSKGNYLLKNYFNLLRLGIKRVI